MPQNLKMNTYDLITIMILTSIITIMVYENNMLNKLLEYIKELFN